MINQENLKDMLIKMPYMRQSLLIESQELLNDYLHCSNNHCDYNKHKRFLRIVYENNIFQGFDTFGNDLKELSKILA